MTACRMPTQPRSSSASWPPPSAARAAATTTRKRRWSCRPTCTLPRRRGAEPAAAAAWPGAAVSPDADRLEAARTVALYCRLIEAGQFARAGELCAHRRLWSRRALGALTRFHFRSARVYAAPDARTLVLKARVHVHAGRGRPLPDGLAVLFFTLGRVGDTVGGWLITAVSTSP